MGAKIEVTCELNIYPEYATFPIGEPTVIKFKNHWNDPSKVVLIVGDKGYELIGEEIERAVKCVRLAH